MNIVKNFVLFQGRFNMIHVQNSTLAGGVAIGTTANVVLEPYHAMLVGCVAAVVSVVGYQYITVGACEFVDKSSTIGLFTAIRASTTILADTSLWQ